MRIAAIVISAIATLAMGVGIFFFWVTSALICLDVCPPVSTAGAEVLGAAGLTLGLGLALTIVGWALALILLRRAGRQRAFVLTLIAPIILIALALIIHIAVAGSLAPVAAPGQIDVSPSDAQVSSDWFNGPRAGVLPLLLWPVVALVASAITPRQP